ncbi:MAG: SAM hydrolase/SAM-dependent halogenase family protein [Planctomycetota bacterium]|jgi:S-adenosylmethionine hydrolase
MPVITLLTDFGTRDHYVAAMKGVILQIAPQVTVVDISHEIDPQDIVRAAFVLRQIWSWYPPDTVHLAVVDPGVGSDRRIIAGRYVGQYVVAPDNGLISMVHRELRVEAVCVVDNRNYMLPSISATFHGRDIMAPVAAHLATGVAIHNLGPPTSHVEVLKLAAPQRAADQRVIGQVLCADRFGNLITNITRQDLLVTFKHRRDPKVYLGQACVGPIRTSYHEVATGEPLALFGSSDHLEISVNCGSAAGTLSPLPEANVEVR